MTARNYRWWAEISLLENCWKIVLRREATKRTKALYKAKGYPDSWIEKRMRGIAIREELTDEWHKRGMKLQREYAILSSKPFGTRS